MRMKTHPQYFLSKPRRSSKVGMTIGIDLGDIWSHYCTLNQDGEVVDQRKFLEYRQGYPSTIPVRNTLDMKWNWTQTRVAVNPLLQNSTPKIHASRRREYDALLKFH